MAKTTNKTNIVVALSAVGVVVLSIFSTVFLVNIVFNDESENEQGYRNTTFTDAVLACESRIKNTYSSRIRTLATDNHSSHFSNSSQVFKIFLKLDLHDKKRTSSVAHYVNCFVRAKNGRIAKFDVLADEEGKGAVVDDGTNAFGIKRR